MFSRQFRALFRLAALWAGPWLLLGLLMGWRSWTSQSDLPGSRDPFSLGGWLFLHALVYAMIGVISGTVAGLVIAHFERGQETGSLSPRRVAAWGALGGLAPLAFLGALGLAFGLPNPSIVPLLVIGLANSALTAGVTASALSVAKRGTDRDGATLDPLQPVRSSLRQIALAQNQYFEDHQTYAANLDALVAATAYRPADGYHAEVAGDREGFTATIRVTTSADEPDRATMWIGDHARSASRVPGVIYCE